MLAAALVACGARSGVEVEPPPEAGPIDGGFDTFPCRWSLAQATPVAASAAGFAALSGAVHGARDEVAIVGAEGEELTGTVLSLGDPPSTLAAVPPVFSGALLGHATGWAQAGEERGACFQVFYGDRFDVLGTRRDEADRCFLEPNDTQRLDLTRLAAGRVHVTSHALPEGARRAATAPTVGVVAHARSARMEPFGWLAVTVEGGRLRAYRFDTGAGASADLGPQREPFALALDRVRPAGVVLRRDPEGIWRLERIPLEGEPGSVPLADLSGLPAEPFGTMVTNETEALIPLRDGRVAVAPVDGSAVRFVGPVPEAPVEELLVIMRPGASAGGLLYTHRAGGRVQLTFRPLTCNR